MKFHPTAKPGVFEVHLGTVHYGNQLGLIGPIVSWGQVSVDQRTRLVTVDGKQVRLTTAGYATIELLAQHRGQTVSREDLCRKALGKPFRAEDRSIDQLIFNIRLSIAAKCGEQFGKDGLIGAHRGVGYFLRGKA